MGAFATSRSATPSARSTSAPSEELAALDLAAIGPQIEGDAQLPQPHERVVVHGARGSRAGSAGSHPRADLRARGGGDAVLGHRRERRGGRATARASAASRGDRTRVDAWLLDGGELEVEVGEDLRVNLTGWARPVFEGRLSEDFAKELHETE